MIFPLIIQAAPGKIQRFSRAFSAFLQRNAPRPPPFFLSLFEAFRRNGKKDRKILRRSVFVA